MGDKVGKIHMKKQNLDKMGGRKISALRKTTRADDTSTSATTAAAEETETPPATKRIKK